MVYFLPSFPCEFVPRSVNIDDLPLRHNSANSGSVESQVLERKQRVGEKGVMDRQDDENLILNSEKNDVSDIVRKADSRERDTDYNIDTDSDSSDVLSKSRPAQRLEPPSRPDSRKGSSNNSEPGVINRRNRGSTSVNRRSSAQTVRLARGSSPPAFSSSPSYLSARRGGRD